MHVHDATTVKMLFFKIQQGMNICQPTKELCWQVIGSMIIATKIRSGDSDNSYF